VLGGFFVTVVLPLAIEHYRIQAELEGLAAPLQNRIQRTRALGIALEWKDLEPNLPPEQNAAHLYHVALAELGKGGPANPAKRAAWVWKPGALEKSARALSLLEQAAARPHCFFPRDWKEVAEGRWNEIGRLKELLDLACAKAEFEARKNRIGSAMGWLKVAATIARHAGEDPSPNGWQVKVDLESLVVESLQRALDPGNMTPKDLGVAREAVAGLSGDPVRALEGELVQRVHFFQTLDSKNADEPDAGGWVRFVNQFSGAGYYTRPYRPLLQDPALVERAFRARVLERWIPFLVAAKASHGDKDRLSTALDAFDLVVTVAPLAIDEGERRLSEPREFVVMTYLEALANRRLAAQALDLVAFRLRTGRFPSRLEEAGEVLLDPFNDKPLRYKRRASGFLLYSIGLDGVDDGGVAGTWNGDVLFELPKSPLPKAPHG